MNYRVVLDSGAPEWIVAVLAAALFYLLWSSMRGLPRRLRLLRAAAAALLLAAVLKPVLQRLEDRFARPRLAVLIDQGPSMHAADDQKASRLSRAVRWLESNRSRLEDRADVTLLGASGGARRVGFDELDGLKPGTVELDPSSAFADVLAAGAPPERVWLISDGAFETGEALGPALAKLRVPVDALGVGPHSDRPAVALTGVRSPDFVFIHGRFPVSAAVEATRLTGREVRLRLWKAGEILGEKRFEADMPYEVFRATFSVEAKDLGHQRYRLEVLVSGKKGPITARREFGVEVIRQKYRIMYLAGRPSAEYSHLRAQLKGDPNHELVSFVILRNPENIAPVSDEQLSLIPFPATEIFVKSLFQFDLFILENFAYWRFHLPVSYLENLKRFVSQGGALLVLGGSNAFTQGGYRGTPLEETLPVKLWTKKDDFVPGLFEPRVAAPDHPLLKLGDTPESTAELWDALPPLDGFSRFDSVRPGSSVLLSHPTEKTASGERLPIVAVREYGRGKVMLVGTDSTWRWKLGGGRDWRISSFYARFWTRAVEYLTGSLELKKVKFGPLPDKMPPREPAVLALHVFDEHFRPVPGSELDLRFSWVKPDGSSARPPFFEREPGVFQVELTELAEGRHTVKAAVRYRRQFWGEDAASFRWERLSGDAPLNRKLLKAVADRSGGSYSDLRRADAAELLAALPPVRRQRSVLDRSALWSSSGWLWAACLLLLLEWLLRRRAGFL